MATALPYGGQVRGGEREPQLGGDNGRGWLVLALCSCNTVRHPETSRDRAQGCRVV